ncbi:hypothetical protein SRCM101294_00072 [Bacillus amyloliquefaciens]|nr:hypothetical protein SRCM101294_00072 [Bacillus amyloliquefaciens]
MPPLQRTTGTLLQTPTLRSGGLKLSYLRTAYVAKAISLAEMAFYFGFPMSRTLYQYDKMKESKTK